MIALVPALVVVVGVFVVALAATRAAAEASELRVAMERLGQLRPALVEVRDAGARLQETAARLHR